MAIRDLLKKIPGVAPFVNAYNIAEAVAPSVRSLITPTTPTYTSPSAVSGFSAQASAGGGGGGGTSAPITKTPAQVAATPAKRVLSPDETNKLNAAYQRIQSGMGSTADKANVDYAKNKGMWTPPTSTIRDISGGSIAPPYTPPGQVNIALETNNSNTRAPLGAGNPAPVQPQKPVDTAASWQKAMTDLLRGAQGQGVDTDLLGQRNALIQARFGAQTAMTPEQLRVLSPGAQAGLRGQDVSGLESQLSGVQTALQGREKERSELRSVMENAQNRLADLESEERGYVYDTAKEERAAAAKMDEPLSYEEAAALGVAYGTTRRQAAAKGIIPTAGAEGSNFQAVKDDKGNVVGAFNPDTGETTYYEGGAGGTPIQVSQEAESNIALVNNLLSDPELKNITGFGGAVPDWMRVPGSAKQMTIANFEQLKGLLSLESRQKLKGQGQISDFEGKLLANAATNLRRGLSDADAKKVLTEIKTAFEVGALGEMADKLGISREEIKRSIEDPEVGYETTKQELLQNLQGFNNAPGKAQKGLTSVKVGNKNVTVSSTISNRLAMADKDYYNATGEHIQVTQSYRTREQQAELYRKSQRGEIGRAAPPGTSFHEKGLAVDVGENWKEYQPYLRKYGLYNALSDDRGHFSYGEFNNLA